MPGKKLRLRILTSEDEKMNEPVDMVIMRCITDTDVTGRKSHVGDLGVLPGHMACSAVLGINKFRIQNDGEWREMAVYGGVVNIRDDVVTVLTEKAEWPEEIDRAQAEAALELAEERMRATPKNDLDLRNNQIQLRRSLVQVEVSAYPLIAKHDWKGE
jgi:F-type H+-transporting ATPase subunit epsilon